MSNCNKEIQDELDELIGKTGSLKILGKADSLLFTEMTSSLIAIVFRSRGRRMIFLTNQKHTHKLSLSENLSEVVAF